jgi:acetyl-CoA carboxylase, biotin carboxylase subunit
VRVIRACRELGIPSVAVYSDVDRASLHVRKADEAYHIGPAAAAESYLNFTKILDVAKRSHADAIHPGYGFLSENAKFAQACADAGVKFIGPGPASMEMMGSKTRARQQMEKAGIPFVPGTSRGLESADQAEQVAGKIGYPVMLKAAAGGGGKGMRLVHGPEELKSALEAAQSEAERAFGDREVYIEKAIISPRHIEMQVLADEHGNTVYLGERECSIQRRHQKVLEESPSPIVDAEMRRRMGDVAVRVARAASYTNAGTVEFLVDQDKEFLFPRNEHAAAGGTSSDRTHHRDWTLYICRFGSRRARSCRFDRKTFRFAGTLLNAAFTLRIPTTIIFRAPAKSRCCYRLRDPEFAAIAACTKAGRFPSITIRCWPS